MFVIVGDISAQQHALLMTGILAQPHFNHCSGYPVATICLQLWNIFRCNDTLDIIGDISAHNMLGVVGDISALPHNYHFTDYLSANTSL